MAEEYTCHNFPEAGNLVNNFHLRQKEAAKNCGMGLTKFKALCESCGITRWPFRCFNSLHPKRSTNVVTAPVTKPADECTCTSWEFENSVIDGAIRELIDDLDKKASDDLHREWLRHMASPAMCGQ